MRAAPADERTYGMDALLAEGFTRRTIYYYIAQGVLPPPLSRGRNAQYSDDHLAILRRVRAARDERKTLEDLREESRLRYRRAFRAC